MRNLMLFMCKLLFLYSCANDYKSINSSIQECTIIFDNIVENKRYNYKSGLTGRAKGLCELSWVNINGQESTFCLDPNNKKDTLRILIDRDQASIQIAHKIQGLDYFFFIVSPGDTLYLSYNKDGIPIVSSLQQGNPINIFKDFYDLYYDGNIDPEIHLRNDYTRQIFARWEEIKDNKAVSRFKLDYEDLDSIFKRTEIVYKKKITSLDSLDTPYKEELIDIVKKMRMYTYLSASRNPNYSPFDSSFYINQHFDQHLISDRLYFTSFFNRYMKNIDLSIKEIDSNLSIPLRRYFTQLKLEYNSEHGHLNNWEEEFKGYLNVFTEETDSLFIGSMKKKYGYSLVKSDLLLKDFEGSEIFLKEVVDTSVKIWYIDFWASWCAPCRKELPHSKRLQEEFKDEAIGFIYLAFNDMEANWKKAVVKEEMESNENNFLIMNSKSADFVNDIELDAIPRYMIMDNKANIIVFSAMRPSNENLPSYLRQLILEN